MYLAFNKMTKEEVAIKFMKVKEFKADSIQIVYREADALKKLSHEKIIKLKMSFPLYHLQSIAIVMDYASGGELKEYLRKRIRLGEEEAYEIFNQIVSAVDYCH